MNVRKESTTTLNRVLNILLYLNSSILLYLNILLYLLMMNKMALLWISELIFKIKLLQLLR